MKIQKLCYAFSDIITDINTENAGEKIANLLFDIIKNAASGNINVSSKNEQINGGVVYYQQGSNTINNYKIDHVDTINC